MFAGFYILARFNIILPLIIQEKIPGYKDFLKMTNQKYLSWVGVSFAIYLPYLLINYFIPNAYVNMFFVTLAMVLFHSFSAAYALENKLVTTGPAEKIIPEKSSKPKIQKEKHAEPKLAMPPRLKQAIEENPKAVNDYLEGQKASLNFLVGQVMRLTRGKADPGETVKLLKDNIE